MGNAPSCATDLLLTHNSDDRVKPCFRKWVELAVEEFCGNLSSLIFLVQSVTQAGMEVYASLTYT